MSTYKIRTAGWSDFNKLQDLGANASRCSPLTNAILSNTEEGHTNTVYTRAAFARFIYQQGLKNQHLAEATRKILKAVKEQDFVRQVQACAWLEWVSPGNEQPPFLDSETKAKSEIPFCVNINNLQYVENTKLWHRKIVIKDDHYYFLRTLDFEPNVEGKNAARALLSRLHQMDPEYAIIAHCKCEHETLYRDLGWQNVGDAVFASIPSITREPYRLRTFLRPATRSPEVAGNLIPTIEQDGMMQ